MADVREPEGWVNSARMSGSYYLYVEGRSDERFWNKFVGEEVLIQVCHGKHHVLKTVEEHNKQGVMRFLAIIDKDFYDILGGKPDLSNLFVTDFHDLEMMLFFSNAFAEAINSIDRGRKIKKYLEEGHDLLQEALTITDEIGYVKLATIKNRLSLLFCVENDSTHDIERPKYEDTFDRKGSYLGVYRLIEKVRGFTESKGEKPETVSRVYTLTDAEKKCVYPSVQLSNGHDISCLIPLIIRRRCGLNNQRLDSEFFDAILYAAYTWEDLVKTKLYEDLYKWTTEYGVALFNRD